MKIKYKSLSHWFTYNWGWLVAIFIAVLLFLFFSSQNNNKIQYDYIITWVGETNLSKNEEKAIKDTVSECMGTSNIQIKQYIVNYSPDEGDTNLELYTQSAMKLLGEIQLDECGVLLLEDPEGFKKSTQYIDEYTLLKTPELYHTAYLAIGDTENGQDLYKKLLKLNEE